MSNSAATAIEICEQLTCWPMYLGVAVREGIPELKEKMRAAIKNAMHKDDPQKHQVLAEALSQWDHPDFLEWLEAKIEKVKEEWVRLGGSLS